MLVAESTVLRRLGRVQYETAVTAMREFTARRGPETPDELWLLEHPPVYTLGQGASEAHGPRVANGIPVVRCERGGSITYHGPGQAVLYTLVDLARRGIGVRRFVRMLEESVIELLGRGETRAGAPGVYVNGAKIAALGLRISRGCAWHGLALNVDMDLAPFAAIDPCGEPGLRVTQTKDLGIAGGVAELGARLAAILTRRLEDA
ncbi:MAG: lipoyl(octanoyl) transferase LipB [Pseudomonadota bacterium]|jgi:lipoyl(octanoyl) transferase